MNFLVCIILYGILMIVSGYCIFKIEYVLNKMSLIHKIEDTLKSNEEIVCENAIVVCDSNGELAWFDTDKELFSLSDLTKNTKDTRK